MDSTRNLLTRTQAAEYLGITPRALQQLNYLGTGPTFVIVGTRTVRYRLADLDQYIEDRTYTRSGDAA